MENGELGLIELIRLIRLMRLLGRKKGAPHEELLRKIVL